MFSKAKEMVVDFRRTWASHTPLHVGGAAVETVSKAFGQAHHLSWSLNSSSLVKKTQHCLYFLRSLKRTTRHTAFLNCFYRCVIESILTYCVTGWYRNCSLSQTMMFSCRQKHLHKAMYCIRKACRIKQGLSHTSHGLFTQLSFGRSLLSVQAKLTSFINNYFPQIRQQIGLMKASPHFISFHFHDHCTQWLYKRHNI